MKIIKLFRTLLLPCFGISAAISTKISSFSIQNQNWRATRKGFPIQCWFAILIPQKTDSYYNSKVGTVCNFATYPLKSKGYEQSPFRTDNDLTVD